MKQKYDATSCPAFPPTEEEMKQIFALLDQKKKKNPPPFCHEARKQTQDKHAGNFPESQLPVVGRQ